MYLLSSTTKKRKKKTLKELLFCPHNRELWFNALSYRPLSKQALCCM